MILPSEDQGSNPNPTQHSTQIKGGDAAPSLPVPAPRPSLLSARQRAATLMAGDTGGSQGQVRVWAPHPWRHWAVLMGSGMAGGAIFAATYWVLAPVIAISYLLAAPIGIYFRNRKLCYLTTDDAGIGVTTREGSKSMKWSDIWSAVEFMRVSVRGLYPRDKPFPGILLQAPDKVEINLAGYTLEERREILALIIERADLVQSSTDQRRFLRRTSPRPSMGFGKGDHPLEETRTVGGWDLPAHSDNGRNWLAPHRH